MRKNYVKPMGAVVALQMEENIALSLGFLDMIVDFSIRYTFSGNANDDKYIKDTTIVSLKGADEVTTATYDLFNLVDHIVKGIQSGNPLTGWENCNAHESDVATTYMHLN